MAKLKALELDLDSDLDLEIEKGKKINDTKPSAPITTMQIQLEDIEDLEEGEYLFHLYMWVKGTPLHLIVDNIRKRT